MNVFIKIVALIAYVTGVMLSVSPFIGRFIIYPTTELYMAHNPCFYWTDVLWNDYPISFKHHVYDCSGKAIKIIAMNIHSY
jgi:hypothetical protein